MLNLSSSLNLSVTSSFSFSPLFFRLDSFFCTLWSHPHTHTQSSLFLPFLLTILSMSPLVHSLFPFPSFLVLFLARRTFSSKATHHPSPLPRPLPVSPPPPLLWQFYQRDDNTTSLCNLPESCSSAHFAVLANSKFFLLLHSSFSLLFCTLLTFHSFHRRPWYVYLWKSVASVTCDVILPWNRHSNSTLLIAGLHLFLSIFHLPSSPAASSSDRQLSVPCNKEVSLCLTRAWVGPASVPPVWNQSRDRMMGDILHSHLLPQSRRSSVRSDQECSRERNQS